MVIGGKYHSVLEVIDKDLSFVYLKNRNLENAHRYYFQMTSSTDWKGI